MLGDKKVLAIITARGGSKGLPGKNILLLAGKPLIVWTVEAALQSRFIDRVVLSSDDQDIINVALDAGCDVPFVRAQELATDSATTVDVVLDGLERLPGYDWLVVLQPTSPLRLGLDIDECLLQTSDAGFKCGVSVCEAEKSPYWMFGRSREGHLETLMEMPNLITRRQDLPPVYELNGAVYVADCRWFADNQKFITPETYSYVMPKDRSIDIDNKMQFVFAEQLLKRGL